MAAIDRWLGWNPEYYGGNFAGELAVGSKFSWKTGPETINSTSQAKSGRIVTHEIGSGSGIDEKKSQGECE